MRLFFGIASVLLLSFLGYIGQDQNQSAKIGNKTEQRAERKPINSPAVQQIPAPCIEGATNKKQETPQPEAKPWLTHGELVMAILTAIYVGATIIYVVISHKTLQAIERQGESSEKQFGQQIGVAQKSADAALLSAQAMMHSERAWILVDIEWQKGRGLVLEGDERMSLGIQWNLRNQGKTIAWIIEKRIGFYIGPAIPDTPDLDATYVSVEDCFSSIDPEEKFAENRNVVGYGTMQRASKNVGVVFGIVKYRDIFNQERYTSFGYQFFGNIRELERLRNHPEYNIYA